MAIIIPILIGVATILQAALNKSISEAIGLAQASLFSNFIVLILSIIFYLLVLYRPDYFPQFFHVKVSLAHFKWWYIIPGIFGLSIVIGLPFAFYKLGAVEVTLYLICSQLIASAIWDVKIENLPLNSQKIIGMLLALSSMVVLNLRFKN